MSPEASWCWVPGEDKEGWLIGIPEAACQLNSDACGPNAWNGILVQLGQVLGSRGVVGISPTSVGSPFENGRAVGCAPWSPTGIRDPMAGRPVASVGDRVGVNLG